MNRQRIARFMQVTLSAALKSHVPLGKRAAVDTYNAGCPGRSHCCLQHRAHATGEITSKQCAPCHAGCMAPLQAPAAASCASHSQLAAAALLAGPSPAVRPPPQVFCSHLWPPCGGRRSDECQGELKRLACCRMLQPALHRAAARLQGARAAMQGGSHIRNNAIYKLYTNFRIRLNGNDTPAGIADSAACCTDSVGGAGSRRAVDGTCDSGLQPYIAFAAIAACRRRWLG